MPVRRRKGPNIGLRGTYGNPMRVSMDTVSRDAVSSYPKDVAVIQKELIGRILNGSIAGAEAGTLIDESLAGKIPKERKVGHEFRVKPFITSLSTTSMPLLRIVKL